MKENENKLNNAFDELKGQHEALKEEFKEMSKCMKDILKPDEKDEKELQKMY